MLLGFGETLLYCLELFDVYLVLGSPCRSLHGDEIVESDEGDFEIGLQQFPFGAFVGRFEVKWRCEKEIDSDRGVATQLLEGLQGPAGVVLFEVEDEVDVLRPFRGDLLPGACASVP